MPEAGTTYDGVHVEILRTLPVTAEHAEELAEVAGALNEVLVEHSLWLDLVHAASQRVYLVLLKTY